MEAEQNETVEVDDFGIPKSAEHYDPKSLSNLVAGGSVSVSDVPEDMEGAFADANTNGAPPAEGSGDKTETADVKVEKEAQKGQEGSKKLLKLKVGESVQDVDPDALLHVADGISIPVKTVLERLKTEDTIRQDFGKLSQLKTIQGEVARDKALLKRATDHLNNKDRVAGIKGFFGELGIDYGIWLDSFMEATGPEYERRKGLTPEQREIEQLRAEREARTEKDKQSQSASEAAKEQSQVQAQINDLCAKHGVSVEEAERTYKSIEAQVASIRDGTFSGTPEHRDYLLGLSKHKGAALIEAIVGMTYNAKILDRAEAALDKVSPELKTDAQVLQEASELFLMGYDDETVVAAIRDVHGTASPEAKKVQAKPSESAAPKAKASNDTPETDGDDLGDVEVIEDPTDVPEQNRTADRPLTARELRAL